MFVSQRRVGRHARSSHRERGYPRPPAPEAPASPGQPLGLRWNGPRLLSAFDTIVAIRGPGSCFGLGHQLEQPALHRPREGRPSAGVTSGRRPGAAGGRRLDPVLDPRPALLQLPSAFASRSRRCRGSSSPCSSRRATRPVRRDQPRRCRRAPHSIPRSASRVLAAVDPADAEQLLDEAVVGTAGRPVAFFPRHQPRAGAVVPVLREPPAQ